MGRRETSMEERKALALGLPFDEDPDEALEEAPEDVSTDGLPLGGNEDPVPDPDGARSEGAGNDNQGRREEAQDPNRATVTDPETGEVEKEGLGPRDEPPAPSRRGRKANQEG